MRMSRFSGYSSGASTTGQRSWGKSKKHKQESHIQNQELYHRVSASRNKLNLTDTWNMKKENYSPKITLSKFLAVDIIQWSL